MYENYDYPPEWDEYSRYEDWEQSHLELVSGVYCAEICNKFDWDTIEKDPVLLRVYDLGCDVCEWEEVTDFLDDDNGAARGMGTMEFENKYGAMLSTAARASATENAVARLERLYRGEAY